MKEDNFPCSWLLPALEGFEEEAKSSDKMRTTNRSLEEKPSVLLYFPHRNRKSDQARPTGSLDQR